MITKYIHPMTVRYKSDMLYVNNKALFQLIDCGALVLNVNVPVIIVLN